MSGVGKGLRPVTAVFIQELRHAGKYAEAAELLKAFRKNSKESYAQENRELMRQEREVRTVLGVCRTVGCKEEKLIDQTFCKKCSKNNKYKRKNNRCIFCGKAELGIMKYCRIHRSCDAVNKLYNKRRRLSCNKLYYKRKRLGVCVTCGGVVEDNRIYCKNDRDMRKKRKCLGGS